MICYGHAIEVTHFKLQIFKLPFKPYCWEAYDQDIVCKFVCFKVCHFGCAMYRGMHKLLGGKPFQQNKPKSPVKLWTFLCQSSGCFLFSFLSRLQIDMPLNELPLPWPVSHSLISVLITLYVWSVWSWWSYMIAKCFFALDFSCNGIITVCMSILSSHVLGLSLLLHLCAVARNSVQQTVSNCLTMHFWDMLLTSVTWV